MTALALIFTLSAIGISETAYLIKKRRLLERPVCPLGGDCNKVLSSRYNHLLGVPNDILGLLSYFAISALSAFLVIGVPAVLPWALFLKLLVAVSVAMSIVLIYLQWKVIKAWCFWCLMSAFTVFAMGIILLLAKI